MRLSGTLWFALLCSMLGVARALNILAITTIATHSHFLWMNTLLSELLSRGHQITEFTFKQPDPHPNRTTFVLESGPYSPQIYMSLINSTQRKEHFLRGIYKIAEINVHRNQEKLATKAFQDLKRHLRSKKESVDLLLIDYGNRDSLIGVSQLVGYPPIIAITAYNHPTAFNVFMGSPQIPALVPQEISPYSCEMTFPERFFNFLGVAFSQLVGTFHYEPAMHQLLRETISPDSLSLSELEQNISMALVNTHSTTHCEQSNPASVVEVGFLHIKPPKPLPKDIQTFLDEASEGVIVVSFGSMIQPDLIAGIQDNMAVVFRKFKQRFLWKTPNPPRNLPPNVMVSKWLPQSDVLAHPNVRLMISHGGTLSMQEAIYRGVPIVVIPFFLDQEANANRVASRGIGRKLNYNELTAETLSREIRLILGNATYKEKTLRLSAIAQDQPESPLMRAVFWVEFVGRHKGTPHFRVDSRRMSWIQYYSLDVIAILTLVIILAVTITTRCLRCLICLFNSKEKTKVE